MMPRPRSGRRRGRPPLQCNLWLEAQIARLANRRYFWHLYDEWLARYAAETGGLPLDPRNSFRQAAYGCIDRIERP